MTRYLLFAFSDCKDPYHEDEFNVRHKDIRPPVIDISQLPVCS
jgi:hypothetical protein